MTKPAEAPAHAPSIEAWGIGDLSLGVSLGGSSTAEHFRRLLRWVDLAEELNLHSVWLPEMHFAPGVSASPLTVLAALAARTRTLRLG
ncbi:LLM class flavin-dependent oxidoreductase, partial [Myxococcota bacterium]|nr:LLM class flavin-dependent oxidoreductase [Myxococcota bacterium]